MALLQATKNELARWYPLDPHDIQLKLKADKARFIVVVAGRRSGKTEVAKRRIIKECWRNPNGLYFIAAPTYNQVKSIYWEDIKKLAMTSICQKAPSESNLIVYFDNGSQLHLIGLDKPKRIEGVAWTGGIIDEFAYIKEDAWNLSVGPALDTQDPLRPGYKPWCWLIGKPDGLNHFYRLYNYALTANDPEWSAYHWKSSLVLPQDVLDAAKRRMSPQQYRQEYEASFETVTGRIYGDYGKDNYTDEKIKDNELIHYFCDFNYTPMSHGIAVVRDNSVYVLDEIILTSAVGEHNALEFVEKYKEHKNKRIRLYGDPSGRAGEKHGLESEYISMERVFRQHGWEVDRRVRPSTRSIKDGQNAVRAKICTANGDRSLFVNPNTAPWMHEGLATVTLKEGSTFQEDDKNEKQHITTALRYFIEYEWPVEDRIIQPEIHMWGMNPFNLTR